MLFAVSMPSPTSTTVQQGLHSAHSWNTEVQPLCFQKLKKKQQPKKCKKKKSRQISFGFVSANFHANVHIIHFGCESNHKDEPKKFKKYFFHSHSRTVNSLRAWSWSLKQLQHRKPPSLGNFSLTFAISKHIPIHWGKSGTVLPVFYYYHINIPA